MSEKLELFFFFGLMGIATISGAIGVGLPSLFFLQIFIVTIALAYGGLCYYFLTQ